MLGNMSQASRPHEVISVVTRTFICTGRGHTRERAAQRAEQRRRRSYPSVPGSRELGSSHRCLHGCSCYRCCARQVVAHSCWRGKEPAALSSWIMWKADKGPIVSSYGLWKKRKTASWQLHQATRSVPCLRTCQARVSTGFVKGTKRKK